ncbi:MAG: hypothetical protein WBF43_01390 [Methylocella sp.]
MGAWGIGLYSCDFALDLRGSVKAVARLPFEPDRLLDYLCAAQPLAANNSNDSDHTIFWLTVADQFAKRGIDCPRARDRALAIIEEGADLAAMAALGMEEKSLVKRRAMLEDLRARIDRPVETAKPRAVLKTPQKLLLEVGDVLTYPTCEGEPINPYAVGKEWEWVKAWKQDGWGALTIAGRGLAFDFLAWYWPLVICEPLLQEPTIADLLRPRMWLSRNAGTLTARHHASMQLKSLGRVLIDPGKLHHFFPGCTGSVSSAVNDISLSNNIGVRLLGADETLRIKHGRPPAPRIYALGDILVAEGGSARGSGELEPLNLSGQWQGRFSYATNKREPVSFVAALSEHDSRLNGEIEETGAVADAAGQTLHATVQGRRLGRSVKFLKVYRDSFHRYGSVQYEGEVNDDATEIAGWWTVPGSWSGRFVMIRPKPPAMDGEMLSTQAVGA